MALGADNQWLVKSSGVILGPYQFDEVVEHIFSGEIHLLDEIKGPFERWRPIKDHSLFAAAIEKLKASTYARRENTVTTTMDVGTRTHEITQTSNTGTPSPTPVITTDETRIIVDPSGEARSGEHQRAYQPPPVPPAKASSSWVFVLSFLLLVVGAGAYYVYDYQQRRLIDQKASAYDQLTDEAVASLRVGDYISALTNFKRAYGISPNDPNLIIEMAPLSVQFDGQFSQSEALVEGLLARKPNDRGIQVRGKTLVGLSYSYRKDFGKAINFYNLALQMDQQFLPAMYNKAYALLEQKEYVQASEILRELIRDYPEEALGHFLYIRTLTESAEATQDLKLFEEALSVSDQYHQNFADLKQEVLFLRAYAHFKLGVPPEELAGYVQTALKVDFELTNLHVHNSLMDFQSFSWLAMMPQCEALVGALDEFTGQLTRSFCMMKINKTVEAKEKLEALLGQNNNNGLLQALYASSLLKLDQLSQAKNSLGFLNQITDKQPVVETILRGCLNANDLSCGRALFQGRHAKHISLLYSHWGNSEINIKTDRKRSRSSIRLGLDISPNFAPLLRMQRNR